LNLREIELALRFVLGKLGGFIQMMFEDNMEVPIGSVKDALIEAVAERECPEDTALIASIFSHIAEVGLFSRVCHACAVLSLTNVFAVGRRMCRWWTRTTRPASCLERSARSCRRP
jgi:hypothetical protein